jgi:predicted acetyltransferase
MLPNITLRDIDDSNFYVCAELQHENERFVVSPTFFLAESYAWRHSMTTYAINHDDEVVGLVQLRNKPATHERNYAITEIFIADNHLRKGYGQQAVAVILHKLKHDNGFATAKVSVDKENHIGQAFFKKCGFTAGGESAWNDDYIDFSINLDNV